MGFKEEAAAILAALEEKGRRRGHRRVTGATGVQARVSGYSADGEEEVVHNFSSNDYLGLAGDERLQDAAIEVMRGSGVGSTASRLILSHSAHDELEEELAGWLGVEQVQLFGSGYAANVGVVSTIAGPGDVVLSDQLNHASMIDGCRLSRAKVVVYPHADLAALEERLRQERGADGRRIILSESVFSMDGDVADVVGLERLARAYGAVLVLDEAHAIGAIGPQGRGVAAAKGVVPDLLVGTFGKAFGSHGAFVAGAKEPVEWLWNRARSLVFSTGLPPMISGATRCALEIIRGQEGDDRRARLAENARRLAVGLGLPEAQSHIIPWLIGADSAAVEASSRLMELGYFAQAIRPPTVPDGTARLRLALGLHASEVVDGLAAAIRGL